MYPHMTKKEVAKRYLCFIIGVLINSFAIAFITKAALGTSPISSIPYVLSLEFTPSLGLFSFIFNMVYIFMQMILLRKDFEKIQLLQIVVNIVFSAFIDVSMNLLSFLNPQNLPEQLLLLLIGCIILGFGIALEVLPGVLFVPGEGVVRAIATVSHREFGNVKVCFDVTLMVTALILSFIFFGHLNGLGAGTIISACIVGFIEKFFAHRLGFVEKLLVDDKSFQGRKQARGI